MKNFTIFTIIFCLFNLFEANGQCRMNDLLIEKNKNVNYLYDFRAIEVDNQVFLNWKTKNDTLEGYILIYKSNNYQDFKLISLQKNNQIGTKKDLVLQNSFKDKSEFPYYNYHIARISFDQLEFLNDNLLWLSDLYSCKIEKFNNINYNFATTNIRGTKNNQNSSSNDKIIKVDY